jgi:dTDP-4-dehydrorhamnose 3,5-epimerase
MKIQPTSIPGVLEITPFVAHDARGVFVKSFQEERFAAHGLATRFAEEYYTESCRRVLRGLHFQTPPHDHAKVVSCVYGKVLDAVVDLRVGSPTYGRCAVFKLTSDRPSLIYIPPGLAHGFYVRSERAVLLYKVTTGHAKEHDSGILWNSAGIPWPDPEPILSERDRRFAPLAAFSSPFRFGRNPLLDAGRLEGARHPIRSPGPVGARNHCYPSC